MTLSRAYFGPNILGFLCPCLGTLAGSGLRASLDPPLHNPAYISYYI